MAEEVRGAGASGPAGAGDRHSVAHALLQHRLQACGVLQECGPHELRQALCARQGCRATRRVCVCDVCVSECACVCACARVCVSAGGAARLAEGHCRPSVRRAVSVSKSEGCRTLCWARSIRRTLLGAHVPCDN